MTNVFFGITVLLSKPFSVGDYIEIAGVGGTVKEINLMKTTLVTPDRKIEMVPNGVANTSITASIKLMITNQP